MTVYHAGLKEPFPSATFNAPAFRENRRDPLLIQDVLEHNARTHPSRPALVSAKEVVTYRELRDQVGGYAAVLRSGGIGKGDRVAILAQNSILYLEALFAVTRAGAALVPLNHLLIGRELVAILENADVKALLFTEEFRDRVEEIRPSLPGIGCFVRIDDPDLPKKRADDVPDPSPPSSRRTSRW